MSAQTTTGAAGSSRLERFFLWSLAFDGRTGRWHRLTQWSIPWQLRLVAPRLRGFGSPALWRAYRDYWTELSADPGRMAVELAIYRAMVIGTFTGATLGAVVGVAWMLRTVGRMRSALGHHDLLLLGRLIAMGVVPVVIGAGAGVLAGGVAARAIRRRVPATVNWRTRIVELASRAAVGEGQV